MKSGLRSFAALSCLIVAGCGGDSAGSGGGSGPGTASPVFSSAATASVAENSTGTAYTATATDSDTSSLTYALTGTDADDFTINASTGAVSFVTRPNFEWPRDADRNNVYAFNVTATDGAHTAIHAVTLTVTNQSGRISARRIGQGFSTPVFVLGRGDGSDRLLVVELGGLVKVYDPVAGTVEAGNFLDVRSQVGSGGERGLLGLALAPDFATSGVVYACLTAADGAVQVRKFTATASGVPAGAGDIILSVPHPLNNHNGGWIGFDAAGNLVVAIGDGGGGGDPNGNGQNTSVLLGKMLRIDPRGDAYPADPNRDYVIPAGNPFASGGGAPEIWHWGLRNPFRNSFDKTTGKFFIGDVGQGAVEEIDLVQPGDGGRNFGWNIREGSQLYAGGAAAGLTDPVYEYRHGSGAFQGASVIGGYVYRGPVTALRGQYIFGDFVNPRIWSVAENILGSVAASSVTVTDRTAAFTPAAGLINGIVSFGEDDMSNLYFMDYNGEIFLVDEVDEAP